MADVEKTIQVSSRRTHLEGNFRSKRRLGLQRLRSFGILFTIISVVSFGFGVWGIVVTIEDEEVVWPYVVPVGCVAAIFALIPSATALHLARCGVQLETSGHKTRQEFPSHVKIQILLIFVSAAYNFFFLLLCCAVAVLGVVLCAEDHSNCDDYGDSKMAVSIAVTVLSLVLWLSSFVFTRWYFVYTRAFGFKTKLERYYDNKHALELQQRQQQQQQQEQQQQQN